MKLRMFALVVIALASLGVATAQNTPEQGKPERPDALSFVRSAADVARNAQNATVAGFLAIYVDEGNWASGLKDSDLGPFLKLRELKPGRSAACFFTQNKDKAVCVYFDSTSPAAVAAVKAGSGGNIQAADIAAAFKPVSKDMLKKGTEELTFNPVDVNTDDGQALPAFVVGSRQANLM